ncbi:MAG: hypothetical protein EBS38_02685 [Actinobacteria bacterium]|nr:hypothetical protein [Actinomycetota bacterium]
MPIPLGILAAAGASQAPAGAFVLLESTVLTGNQASVEFTNLTTKYASTYQHLQIRYVEHYTQDGFSSIMQFNGVSTASYASHGLWASGSGPFSSNSVNATSMLYNHFGIGHTSSINTPTVGVIDILDPFETTKNKTIRSFGGQVASGANLILLHSGFWNSTASITTIRLATNGSPQFATGCRFSLYGLKATA